MDVNDCHIEKIADEFNARRPRRVSLGFSTVEKRLQNGQCQEKHRFGRPNLSD